jgi:hypothetical protein
MRCSSCESKVLYCEMSFSMVLVGGLPVGAMYESNLEAWEREVKVPRLGITSDIAARVTIGLIA